MIIKAVLGMFYFNWYAVPVLVVGQRPPAANLGLLRLQRGLAPLLLLFGLAILLARFLPLLYPVLA